MTFKQCDAKLTSPKCLKERRAIKESGYTRRRNAASRPGQESVETSQTICERKDNQP